MRLGTSLSDFAGSDVPLDTCIELCAEAGFEVIDFDQHNYAMLEDPPFRGPAGRAWCERLRRTAEDNGLVFSQMHGPLHPMLSTAPDAERNFTDCVDALDVAEILGVPWTVFHPGTVDGKRGPEYRPANLEASVGFLAPLANEAANRGVGIAIENTADWSGEWSYCSRPEDLIELVDTLDSDNVGICWDTGHANFMGLDQFDSIVRLGERLKMLHLHDNDGEGDDHTLPFTGTIDWSAVMNGLRTADYRGDFVYEATYSLQPVPTALKPAALRYAVEIGRWLIDERTDQ